MCVDGMENMVHIILQKAIFFFFSFLGWISAKSFLNENKNESYSQKGTKKQKDGKN